MRLAAIVGLTTAGSAASAGTVVLVAAASGSLALSVAGGLVCAVAAAWTGSAVARRRRDDDGPHTVLTRPILGPVVVFGCIAVVSASWLWPGLGAVRPPAAPGATWLSRPDGSRLAVHVTRAATATDPPLIVVHGGPGVADMAHDVEALAALATTRDVYIYDQVGAGASTRLSDPDGYTTARAVEDLEAVRVATGSQRVALLGHSWGRVWSPLIWPRIRPG